MGGFKLNLKDKVCEVSNKTDDGGRDENDANSGGISLGLNFANLPANHMDFQTEFLQHYEDFSPSWRKEVDRMKNRK